MRRHYYLSAFSCGLLTALAWGCQDNDKGSYDADGDGFDIDLDCDDSDFNVNPEASEICGDNIDNDCDGVDTTCMIDNDGDGYHTDDDCDDSDDLVHPGATEDCMSEVDENCDGIVAECVYASLIYDPISPYDYDAYDAAVFADYVIFGEPGNGVADGRALFFEHDAGVVDELGATLVSDGAVGQIGAYGTSISPLGDNLCITADYQDDGLAADVGKSWCFSESTIRAASGSLPLTDASFTTSGETQSTYSKAEAEVDVDGDGNLDLLVYTSQGVHVILGSGSPWSGDYVVPSGADLTLGNCGTSNSGWCGFGRALHGAAPVTLALAEEGGTPDTISLFSLPLVGGSTVPTAAAMIDRASQDSGTGVELISGVAFGHSLGGEVTFLDGAGTVVGSITGGVNWFGYWISSFIDARGHELLLVSAPYDSDPTWGTGLGVVYVFDLTRHGLPSSLDEAQYRLVPPEGYFECGWRARGGVVNDGNGAWSVVAVSCPSTGGAAYHLNYQINPPPPVYATDIYATEQGQYNIRQWVVDAYTSELEWLTGLAQTEVVVAQGKIVGWRLHKIESGSPLYRAGLRTGDVLRKVNGIDVTSPAVVNQLYQTFQNAEALNIGIVRNGTPHLLQYTIVP